MNIKLNAVFFSFHPVTSGEIPKNILKATLEIMPNVTMRVNE